MSAYQIAAAATMTVMVAIAVYTDVRVGKIFNLLTGPCILLGLALNAAWGGLDGVGLSIEGIGLGLGIFIASSLFFGRLLGGGDIKLLMAIGAIQGPTFLLWTSIYMAISGGILAVIVSGFRHDFIPSLKRLWASIVLRVFAQVKVDVSDASSTARLPYAIPIALGSLAALWVLQLQALYLG